jgi:vacuolar protein sorting-associated protein 13A/C
MQFYKLLGSADLIGNPVGLVNKLGTGVYELISEPSKGLLKGPDEFVGGVGKGVQSLVSNVISGSFESMSKITGSLYSVVKNVSGEQNVQIRRSEHIGEGIYYGVKGGVKELVSGVTGIVTKPIQKTREEGAKGFFKGLGSGIVGAITAPVTATLRAGTSLTQGVAASATSFGKYGRKVVDTNSMYSRFRPPRYINARNVVSDYDESLACVR